MPNRMMPRNSKRAEAVANYWNKNLDKRDWYNIAANGNIAEVRIYDVIGWPFVDAQDFLRELDAHRGKDLVVSINSPGGDVFDGFAIFNALSRWQGNVTTRNDGLAASAASYILMAGKRVESAKNAFTMIHNAWGLVIGEQADMIKTAAFLEKIDAAIATHYVDKTGKPIAEIRKLMDDETWFTGEEAKDMGLVDSITNEKRTKNAFNLSVYDQTPDALLAEFEGEAPTERNIERALRDAGLSRAQAKAFVSSGIGCLRDADSNLRDADASELKNIMNNIMNKNINLWR